MTNFDTVREALAAIADTHVHTYKQALTALAEIERQHYTPEDMADAQAKAFRAGVASVTAGQGQEPVAWMYDWLPAGGPTAYDWISGSKDEVFAPENCYFNIRPLYTAAPVAQQQGEVVVTWDEQRTRILAVDRMDGKGYIQTLDVIAATPAQQPQAEAPTIAQNKAAPVASWNDSRTQKVYEVLTNDNYPPKGSEEHWEGWKARLVVDALFPEQPQAEAVPRQVTEREHNVLMRALARSGKKVEAPPQAQATHQYDLAHRLRVHLANRHTLTGPEFTDGVEAILAEYYAAPQQAEAVPPGYVLVPVEPTAGMCKAAADAWLDCGSRLVLNKAGAAVRAAIAQQKGASHE